MDQARVWTDSHLREMEDHIRAIYEQAQSEIMVKWNAYMVSGQSRLDSLYADYVSAPAGQKDAALRRYQDALQNYTLRNQWYKDMVDETTFRLANVNQMAIAYVNNEMPAIYAVNFNQLDPDVLLIRSQWTLRNEQMIRNLMMDSLPYKDLDYAKDMAWNRRQINSAVLQGVLQGESIPKIARRLMPIVGNNRASAIRTARTMVTGAENRGRYDRYREYVDEGIIMAKVWIATPDGRTRKWHLDMDGQEVPVDEPFVDGHGNELMFPGDDEAEAETVYNCRCSMRSHVMGVQTADGRVIPIENYRTEETMHQRQIREERERRAAREEEDDYE